MKRFFTNPRIIILLVALLLALYTISPQPWAEGVAIRSVAKESAASSAGIPSPSARILPVARERILSVNNQPVTDTASFYHLVDEITATGPNRSFTIRTDADLYSLTTEEAFETIILPEVELVNATTRIYNESLDAFVNVTTQELQNKTEQRSIGVEDIGLVVYDAPTTNIRKGLDLSGGTRVILQPAEPVVAEDLELIINNIKERLNVFGLSDLVVRGARDLAGTDFIIVEIAGANKDEVRDLLSQQGKFEARIGETTVFRGGDKDITYVCRSADCSGIDPQAGCGVTEGTWFCRFRFAISLSPRAAQQQAAATRDLPVVVDQGGSYLSEPLSLYLDDEFVDSLQIGSDLKGRAVTDIQISGSGAGASQQEAIQDALANMKQLQTVMITGSLPVKLEIVKTDSISPVLGDEFIRNALLIGLLSMLVVVIVVVSVYRKLIISIPMIITMVSEVVLILGFASLVGWNLDLAAIAAIIIAIGTSVDHQIVIADETLRGAGRVSSSWKEKVKRAFFIITAAYVTTIAAMLPLWFAGAGLLRGFAITTIIGVSIGVFITRPAYAAIMQLLFKEE